MADNTEWFNGLNTCHAKKDRERLRPWMAILAGACLAALVAAAKEAYGADAFKSKDEAGSPIVLRLFNEPCSPVVMKHVEEKAAEYKDKFQRSTLLWQGKTWESCWVEIGGRVYSIDSAGDILQPPIPRPLFKEDTV